MRSAFSLPALVLLAIAIATPIASAQNIFITPVPNAPFSAVVEVERSWTHTDGSVASFKTTRDIARDTRGRIHNERRGLVRASDTKTPPLLRVHVYDPQTRLSTWLIPERRTFWSTTTNHPPSAVPPSLRYASPAGDGLPSNEFAKEEDLGIHEMEGLAVRGIRETQTIPDSSGKGKEVVVTDEYWYSEDLRINVMIKHSDPRKGTVTMTVTQISRAEPDATLFEIPQGYKRAGATEEVDQ